MLVVDPGVTAAEIDALAGSIAGMGGGSTSGSRLIPTGLIFCGETPPRRGPRLATPLGARTALDRWRRTSARRLVPCRGWTSPGWVES